MESPVLKLEVPYTMLVSGQTGSGKSWFVRKLLQNQEAMHDKPFERIIYAYSVDQPLYREIQQEVPMVEFSLGLPEDLGLDGRNTLLYLDDLMLELQSSKKLASFFTRMRHENLSTIFIVQNLFFKSTLATTINRNSQYMAIFPNMRDSFMISVLGRQIYPTEKDFIVTAFREATAKPFGYLFLDLKTTSDSRLRVRTGIFPGDFLTIFRPKP